MRIRVAAENQDRLRDFLRRATPYYEQPGGITVTLLQRSDDPEHFVEVVRYREERAYELDQARVRDDPVMKGHLAEWRTLLAEPPVIEVYRVGP